MPVLMVHDGPGGTKEQYDEVCSRLTGGRGLNSLSDWSTGGILSHAAGQPITAGVSWMSGNPRRRSSVSER